MWSIKIIICYLFKAFAGMGVVQCGMSSLEYLQDLSHVFEGNNSRNLLQRPMAFWWSSSVMKKWLYTSNLGRVGHSHFSPLRLNQASRGSYPLFIWRHSFSTVQQRKLNLITAVCPSIRRSGIAEGILHGCLERWPCGSSGEEQRQDYRKSRKERNINSMVHPYQHCWIFL